MTNPLVELQKLGQSPWHDNIRRQLLTSGALRRMVDDGDITGLTSNPTIFEQAIAAGHDYDAQLHALARQGKSADEIFDALAIKDISDAADVFAPVYQRTGGADGYVSIEVAPRYANDTARTIDEAHRLWDAVRKPNVMVKIPATAAGVPAIAECIADGLNINVTLIFSLDRYDAVMDAYLTGLERRRAAGKPINRIASVASFFVSRVDGEIDKRLDAKLASAAPDQAAQLKQLKGGSAIANAKLAYLNFRKKFSGSRYVALASHGAQLQRPLWASTSTKNPAYPDLYYVEALIAPDTVDTMPPATLVAYKDHGRPEVRIDRDVDGASALLQRLADAGISMDEATTKLEVDGVAAFAKSYDSLIATVTTAMRTTMGAAAPQSATRESSVVRPRPQAAAPKSSAKKPAAKSKASRTGKPATKAKRAAKPKRAAKAKRSAKPKRAANSKRAAKPKRAAKAKRAAKPKRATSAKRARKAKPTAKRGKKAAAPRRGKKAGTRTRATRPAAARSGP